MRSFWKGLLIAAVLGCLGWRVYEHRKRRVKPVLLRGLFKLPRLIR